MNDENKELNKCADNFIVKVEAPDGVLHIVRIDFEKLPCNTCEWRYSLHCPHCEWNKDGKYITY